MTNDCSTEERQGWIERYAYAMMKAGALIGSLGPESTIKDNFKWEDFKTFYLLYTSNVPRKVRRGFKWNSTLDDLFCNNRDLENIEIEGESYKGVVEVFQ